MKSWISRFRKTPVLEAVAAPIEERKAPEMDAGAYRLRLFQEVYAQDARLKEAHALIRAAIETLPNEHDREHVKTHEIRYLQTIALLPDGPGELVDIGAAPHYAEPLRKLKKWNLHNIDPLSIDFEEDTLPFPDASCDAVLLCEVIEHFVRDPLFCLIEINRILKPGGCFILTTPNAASWFSIYEALNQRHTSRWPVYSNDPQKARNHIHAREYTCGELRLLLDAAGFGEFRQLTLDYALAPPFKPIAGFDANDRGETIFVRSHKIGRPRARYIAPIYLETELLR